MSETMVERVGRAIDAVQIWSRFNDWTSDRVEGLPIEICRHAAGDVVDPVVIKRFAASKGEDNALREVVSEMRARAAIEAMREPGLAIRKITTFEFAEVEWPKLIDAALTTPGPEEGI